MLQTVCQRISRVNKGCSYFILFHSISLCAKIEQWDSCLMMRAMVNFVLLF